MDLSNLMSGALGAIVVSLLDFLFLRKQGKLEERVTVLETEKFAKLEKKLDDHVTADRSGEIWTVLRSINGNIEKLLSQNQTLLISNETQRQQIITLFNNQTEMKQELKECRKDHKNG